MSAYDWLDKADTPSVRNNIGFQNITWLGPKETHYLRTKEMKIKPSNYPQLKLILWNRNDEDLIDEEEAFALYERNWHHIDQASLTPHEKTLIDDLTKRLGAGVMNV